KFSPFVTSDRREDRKRHLNAPPHIRRKVMSSPLSKELRRKHDVRSMPIREGDEAQVVRGYYKGSAMPVALVYRKPYATTWSEGNGRCQRHHCPLGRSPSKAVITRRTLDKDKQILERRATARQVGKERGKYKEGTKNAQAHMCILMHTH
uniref:60S ribosomal protein L26 n=1 Tax=Myotis lucifugus TaxID=59463 RepID=G1Q3J6_MYOLU